MDDTFPNSYGISFGFFDTNATVPPSASFSQFVYMPLADSQANTNPVTATTTVLPTQDATAPYTAAVPGNGCDKGSAQWQPFSDSKNHGTVQCLPDGLSVSQDETAQGTSNVSFDGFHNFPANYRVSVHLDFNQFNSCPKKGSILLASHMVRSTGSVARHCTSIHSSLRTSRKCFGYGTGCNTSRAIAKNAPIAGDIHFSLCHMTCVNT